MSLLDTKTVNVATVSAPTSPPAVPTLSSPPNGATGVAIPVTLSWNAATGAASYRVQVALDSTFVNVAFDQANIQVTQVTVGNLQANTQYFWRVNATNQIGTSDWSQVWSFTTGAAAPDIFGPLMAMACLMMVVGMTTSMMPKEQ